MSCKWQEDEDCLWSTGCGNMWHFECDGPVENGVKFCMYCGASIELIEYAESSEFYCNRDDCEYWFCYGDKSCCRNIPYGPNCLLRKKPDTSDEIHRRISKKFDEAGGIVPYLKNGSAVEDEGELCGRDDAEEYRARIKGQLYWSIWHMITEMGDFTNNWEFEYRRRKKPQAAPIEEEKQEPFAVDRERLKKELAPWAHSAAYVDMYDLTTFICDEIERLAKRGEGE